MAAPALPFLDEAALDGLLDYPSLIAALRAGFAERRIAAPQRHHHRIGANDLLLMPAWEEGKESGVKIVTVAPDNPRHGMGAVQGVYVLLDGPTGRVRALLDAPVLTRRRTAAASALAASFLARPESAIMAMLGTGALCLPLIEAHASQFPLAEILIWGRTPDHAEARAREATARGLPARAVTDRAKAIECADIVTAATLSTDPLIAGDVLRSGAHVDLVGAYRPDMRESDDAAITRSRLFVDSREGALAEAGDILQPLQAGLITEASICADLFDLCRGAHAGRRDPAEITLFKSVGLALEDLVAARLALARLSGAPTGE
ncbi:MAG TPA: ornithine cyclodeaminase family protein [Dongiaceae bacterium]|jgi:ornithine cyclodeaminase|nr:ornithine cyclodeaminase family protein [Dongiaceae bacterium]